MENPASTYGEDWLEQGVAAPVIYITGNDSPANRAAALGSGCIAYLIKPFTGESLIESVERAGIS